jgi:hypothetical protein
VVVVLILGVPGGMHAAVPPDTQLDSLSDVLALRGWLASAW